MCVGVIDSIGLCMSDTLADRVMCERVGDVDDDDDEDDDEDEYAEDGTAVEEEDEASNDDIVCD